MFFLDIFNLFICVSNYNLSLLIINYNLSFVNIQKHM